MNNNNKVYIFDLSKKEKSDFFVIAHQVLQTFIFFFI